MLFLMHVVATASTELLVTDTAGAARLACEYNGLTYAVAKKLLPAQKMLQLRLLCSGEKTPNYHNEDVDKTEDLTGLLSLTIGRQTLDEGLEPLTDDALRFRRIAIPVGHASCSASSGIACVPGPCRLYEYDYQSTLGGVAINKHSKRMTAPLTGKARCGPLFGLQGSDPGDPAADVPKAIDEATIHFFPSLNSGPAPALHDAGETRVPVARDDSLNGNPRSYYKTIADFHQGVDPSLTYKPKRCSQQHKSPYVVQNKHTAWSVDGNTHTLGPFDALGAISNFPDYADFVGGTPMTAEQQQNRFLNTIPQLRQDFVAAEINRSNSTDIAANRTDSEWISDYDIDGSQHTEEMHMEHCDLSQCEWLPTMEGPAGSKFDDDTQQQLHSNMQTCFFAELLKKYVDALQIYCSASGTSSDARVQCRELERMIGEKTGYNPGHLVPEFCYSVKDTPITRADALNESVFENHVDANQDPQVVRKGMSQFAELFSCHDHPSTNSFYDNGWMPHLALNGVSKAEKKEIGGIDTCPIHVYDTWGCNPVHTFNPANRDIFHTLQKQPLMTSGLKGKGGFHLHNGFNPDAKLRCIAFPENVMVNPTPVVSSPSGFVEFINWGFHDEGYTVNGDPFEMLGMPLEPECENLNPPAPTWLQYNTWGSVRNYPQCINWGRKHRNTNGYYHATPTFGNKVDQVEDVGKYYWLHAVCDASNYAHVECEDESTFRSKKENDAKNTKGCAYVCGENDPRPSASMLQYNYFVWGFKADYYKDGDCNIEEEHCATKDFESTANSIGDTACLLTGPATLGLTCLFSLVSHLGKTGKQHPVFRAGIFGRTPLNWKDTNRNAYNELRFIPGMDPRKTTRRAFPRRIPRFSCGSKDAAKDYFRDEAASARFAGDVAACMKVAQRVDNGVMKCLVNTMLLTPSTHTLEIARLYSLVLLTLFNPKHGDHKDKPVWDKRPDATYGTGNNIFEHMDNDAESLEDVFAFADMLDGFDFDAAEFAYHYFDTKPTTDTDMVQPLVKAVTNLQAIVPKPSALNASFQNSAFDSESHSCNCGNSPIVYTYVVIPMDEAHEDFRTSYDSTEGNTVLIEAGLAWRDNVGDLRGSMPVGLYIPSHPKYTYNVVLYERDFLAKPALATQFNATDNAMRYFLGDQAPLPDTLVNELQFSVDAGRDNLQGEKYRKYYALNTPPSIDKTEPYEELYRGMGTEFHVTKFTYKYGSCMRFPYGQIPRMEMHENDKTKYFPHTLIGSTNMEAYDVEEESLIGYCEDISATADLIQHAFCFGDPQAHRVKYCKATPHAQYNVIGQAMSIRKMDHICSVEYKTCLVIPGDPVHPTVQSVLADAAWAHHGFDNYTILITPFNFSAARMLMGPGRKQLKIGGGTRRGGALSALSDSAIVPYGVPALSRETFDVLSGAPHANRSASAIQDACEEISLILNNTLNVTGQWPALLAEMKKTEYTTETLYPPLTETRIRVQYKNMRFASALKDYPIQFINPPNAALATCNRFLVAAPGFHLDYMYADQSPCRKAAQHIDKAAVLYGGADVHGSYITVAAPPKGGTPIIFVGDDTQSFAHTRRVLAHNVTIIIATPMFDKEIVVAAARTVTHMLGNITVRYLPNASVAMLAVIQPMRHAYCTICLEAHTNSTLTTINATVYTSMFGDNVMRQEYPIIDVKAHAALAAVVVLALANAALLAAGCLAWLHARQGPPPLHTHTAAGFVIRPSIFGMQAIDTATGRSWNARTLRQSLQRGPANIPPKLHAHLLESALKME